MALVKEGVDFQSFITAIKAGTFEAIQQNLPLPSQINNPSYEICQCLNDWLGNGRVVELVPETGFTLLHYIICHEEHPEVAWMLIENGASLITHVASPAMRHDRTVLHEAAYMNQPDLVERILQQTTILMCLMDQPTIGTPLTLALYDNFVEDITHDERCQTLYDNERIIMHLLQYRECAVSTRICNLSRLLESRRDADVKERFTKKWVQQAYPVEHKCDNEWPPLVIASSDCYPGIIEALLQGGADPNAPDRVYGFRPLAHLGSSTWKDDAPLVEAARLLVKAGAKPSDVVNGEHKQTVLDIILAYRYDLENFETAYVRLADFFLNEGMCANAEDRYGRTLFARAIDRRNLALGKKIFEFRGGPKPNEYQEMIDRFGRRTPRAAEFIQRRDQSVANSQQALTPLTRLQMAGFIIELLDEYPSVLRSVFEYSDMDKD